MKGERRVYIILRLCTNEFITVRLYLVIKEFYLLPSLFGPLLLLNGRNGRFCMILIPEVAQQSVYNEIEDIEIKALLALVSSH